MNIFVLDLDVKKCAEYHVDKHCVKMVLETTQLLNNVLIRHDPDYVPVYRQTHKNHPASIWAGDSRANFDWLLSLGLALCAEYTFRYGKQHKCQAILESFGAYRDKIPDYGLTPFVKCMPDQYKVDDAVESYRNYYYGDKGYIAVWSKRNAPDWWKAKRFAANIKLEPIQNG
jgi:hypothetical protein